MCKKSIRKGLTLVEILVVTLIIALLIAISVRQYDKLLNNNRKSTVENDLSGWMSDINQYIEDYGPFRVEFNDDEATDPATKDRYLAYLYFGNKGDASRVSSIPKQEASNYEENSPLYILQAYCTNEFVIENVEEDVVCDSKDKHYIILTTRYKKDPWGRNYKIICDTKSGTIIVASAGENTLFGVPYKKNGDEAEPTTGYGDYIDSYAYGLFGDDIILVIQPKE